MSGDRRDIVGVGMISDHPGTIVLGASTTLLFVAAIVVGVWRGCARARFIRATRAKFRESPRQRLVAGPVIVAGTVEAERPDLPVVVVETPPRRPSDPPCERPSHLENFPPLPLVRPFTLVVNGTKKRLAVLPGVDVDVWGRRILAERRDAEGAWQTYLEVAVVSPGERVVIRGTLRRKPRRGQDGSHRGPSRAFALEAARGERLVIETESSVVEMKAAAAELNEKLAVGFAALTYVPALGSYLRDLARSTTRDVKVVEQSTGVGSERNGLALADGLGCLSEASAERKGSTESSPCIEWRYASVRDPSPLAPGDRVTVTIVPGWPDRAHLGGTLLPEERLVQMGCWPALGFLMVFFVLGSVLNYFNPWSVWFDPEAYSSFTYRRRKRTAPASRSADGRG